MQGRDRFAIWDVGLGAGANALAMVEALGKLENQQTQVELWSFEQTLEPLRFALAHARDLVYPERWEREIAQLLAEGVARIGRVRWRIEQGDFRQRVAECEGPAPDGVIFDPYSPAANPGMWTQEVFRAIRSRAGGDCVLTSYSRSTVIRARLMLAGWYVGRGAATGEKNETTIAATRLEELRAPLGLDWLQRVRRSRAAGLREEGMTADSVADALAACPQMRPARESRI
jgi:tRNA U34 5-methylaminomethyl-2-thiouridine-forming methyltransferase MnmC